MHARREEDKTPKMYSGGEIWMKWSLKERAQDQRGRGDERKGHLDVTHRSS